MRILILLLFPICLTAQAPKKATTILAPTTDPAKDLKLFAKVLLSHDFEVEFDADLGMVEGEWEDPKPLGVGVRMKVTAFEKGGKVTIKGKYQVRSAYGWSQWKTIANKGLGTSAGRECWNKMDGYVGEVWEGVEYGI